MVESRELNLCPNSKVKPVPAFRSKEEYERFKEEFIASVKLDVERYAIARANSELRARYPLVS